MKACTSNTLAATPVEEPASACVGGAMALAFCESLQRGASIDPRQPWPNTMGLTTCSAPTAERLTSPMPSAQKTLVVVHDG